jgi:hypothetical protein
MAAGQGFKTFTTGEVLTAADVNGYLMQGVLVFASAAARNAAITSPQEGQFAFTKDTNSLWYYDGAAWVSSGATGDIEGVTAGVGITGGGTSGTVTVTNDMATTITAAGDIVVGTGSGTYDNLPIGTTNQILTADTSVSPYKVKWATPASSGSKTVLASGSMSGSGVTLSSISQGYKDLQLVLTSLTWSTGTDHLGFRVNGITSANYRSSIFGAANGTTYTTTLDAAYDTSNRIYLNNHMTNTSGLNHCVINYTDYASASDQMLCNWALSYNNTTSNYFGFGPFSCQGISGGITSISIFTYNGNYSFNGGTYTLYGVN